MKTKNILLKQLQKDTILVGNRVRKRLVTELLPSLPIPLPKRRMEW